MSSEDEDQCELAQRGDKEAYGRLVGKYIDQIARIINRKVGPSDTDDVVQEVLLEAWRKLDTYDKTKGSFQGWIRSIAARRGIDHARRRSSFQRACEGLKIESDTIGGRRNGDPIFVGGCSIETDDERIKFIQEVMAELPPVQAQVLRLTLDGLSQREIARRLGNPLGTVKTRIELGTAYIFRRAATFRLKERIAIYGRCSTPQTSSLQCQPLAEEMSQ